MSSTYQKEDIAPAKRKLLGCERSHCGVSEFIFGSPHPIVAMVSYWIGNIPVVSSERYWPDTGCCDRLATDRLIFESISLGSPERQVACLKVPVVFSCKVCQLFFLSVAPSD